MCIKIKPYSFSVAMALAWAIFVVPSGETQTNAFMYQGQLMNNGQPANRNYDITFTLFGYNQYGFPVGPVLTNLNTPVSADLLSVTMASARLPISNNQFSFLTLALRGS